MPNLVYIASIQLGSLSYVLVESYRDEGINSKAMNRKTVVWLIVVFVLALLVLAKWRPWSEDTQKPQAVRAGGQVTNVKAYLVKAGQMDNKITVAGTLLANEEVELKSEVTGKITNISFQEGSRVRKGDVLVKINDADLQAQRLRAELQLKLAQDTELRQRKQLEIEAVSQEVYDAALTRLNTAKADLQLIQAQIEKAAIIAPFDGVIGLRYVSEGSYISPDTKIAYLVDRDPIKIDFSIPERYADFVRVGDQITFKTQGNSDVFTGNIYALEPKVDPEIRSVRIRAHCPNPEGKVRPGSFAEVTVSLSRIEGAIMIPTETLIPEMEREKVFVAKEGKAQQVYVETGLRTSDKVQIIRGLAVNDTLLTTGLLQVRTGSPVRITSLD